MKLFRCYSNPNEQTARYAARERRWMGPWRKKGGQGCRQFSQSRACAHRDASFHDGLWNRRDKARRESAAGGWRDPLGWGPHWGGSLGDPNRSWREWQWSRIAPTSRRPAPRPVVPTKISTGMPASMQSL